MDIDNLEEFIAENLSRGVDSNKSDFDANFRYTLDTLNLSCGIQAGIGPRYGVAPIPGHATQDSTGQTVTTDFAGQMLSELASPGMATASLTHRSRLFGMAKISFGSYADINTKIDAYVWLIGHDMSGTLILDAVLNSNQDIAGANGITQVQPNFYQGLGAHTYFNSSAASSNSVILEYFPKNGTVDNSINSFLALPATTRFLSFASLSISGQRYPYQWFVGRVITDPDNTHTGIPNFFQATSIAFAGTPIYGGISPEMVAQNYRKGTRALTFYNLNEDYQLIRSYVYTDYNVVTGTYVSLPYDANTAGMVISVAATGTQDRWDGTTGTAGWANSDAAAVLVNDPDLTIQSSYKAIVIAGNTKPYALVLQDWRRSPTKFNQWIDLTKVGHGISSQATLRDVGGASPTPTQFYTESYVDYTAVGTIAQTSTVVATCFSTWPLFVLGTKLPNVTAGTTPGASDPQQVLLGAANTGVLRANNVYEFTFAVFDKRLGFETNVGVPAKVQTGTDDFVAITLFNDVLENLATDTYEQNAPFNIGKLVVPPGLDDYFLRTNADINYLELRFYYREWGSDTWLPALFIDAAKYFFFPNHVHLYACTGDARGLPGGVPGGVIDHSPLPDEGYTSVISYRNRSFWFSKDSLRYSAFNNIFEYPIRNVVPIPQGEYRGGLAHVYPGQSEQSSRLLIYGTREIYTGRFTGNFLSRSVQLDQDNSVDVQLDGSDFVVDSWTTNTAFSYRSAVIAEGIHFYWGPQGIYMDNGVDVPQKITGDLEPDIFELYDSSATLEIFCVYSAQTREIIWFYPPLGGDGTTTGLLIYDLPDSGFLPGRINCKVDNVQKLEVTKNDLNGGDRTLIITRENGSTTIQRAQFFDFKSRSGDMTSGKEMLVKQVSTPSTGVRRFTLATGYAATPFSSLAVGDRISLDGIATYSGSPTQSDVYAKVIAKGVGTLDITLPASATLTAATYTYSTFFPLYVNRTHGFPWVIDPKYWVPRGMRYRAFWDYLYLLMKYQGPVSDLELTALFEHRSATSPGYISQTLYLSDNSDGNCQIITPLEIGNENMDGAGIKMRISGTHIAYKWVLQYLSLYARQINTDILKFENRGEMGNGG